MAEPWPSTKMGPGHINLTRRNSCSCIFLHPPGSYRCFHWHPTRHQRARGLFDIVYKDDLPQHKEKEKWKDKGELPSTTDQMKGNQRWIQGPFWRAYSSEQGLSLGRKEYYNIPKKKKKMQGKHIFWVLPSPQNKNKKNIF